MERSKRRVGERRGGGWSASFSGVLFAGTVLSGCTSPDEELLRQYRSYYHQLPEEHPARFAVNQTAEKPPSVSYRLRFGVYDDRDPDSVREQIRAEIARIEEGIRWTGERREIELTIGGPPVVFSGEYPLGGTAHESENSIWSIRCDRETITVTGDFPDAECRPNDEQLYRGDALEMFFCTNYEAKLYREIIVNPNGTIFTALHVNDRFGSFQCVVPNGKEKYGIAVQTEKRDNGFRLETSIPWRALPEYTRGNPPRAGEVLYFMLVRTNSDQAGEPSRMTTPVPLLYSPHNLFGYIKAVLKSEGAGKTVLPRPAGGGEKKR